MAEISLEKNNSNNCIETDLSKGEKNTNEKGRKLSLDSSKSESFISNLNTEIKQFVENEEDLSFSSNSNSEQNEPQINIEDLLDSKYWRMNQGLRIEDDYQNKKELFPNKKYILFLNEEEKDSTSFFGSKNEYRGDKVIISEGSNKLSTQGNEDEEMRNDHLINISDSENSLLNSLSNIESDENEYDNNRNCDQIIKDITNKSFSSKEDNILPKDNNKDLKNIINSNLPLNGYNFNIEKMQFNEPEFVFPYEPVQNQNKNSFQPFFPASYINQPFCGFNSNLNLPSPLSNSSFLPINNNNKIINKYSQNNDEEFVNQGNNINGQNNKFINTNINNYNKKPNLNQKDLIELPLIINQTNSQTLPINFNYSKLNLNMNYYPKIPNNNISNNKPSLDKVNNISSLTNNLSDKKLKNNNITFNNEEHNHSSNNININFNSMIFNKMKINYKNMPTNKNMNNNNAVNKTSLKGEKQVLNLDDIVSGKDTRTTVMIRNIPIKYTDEILNDELSEFHGKYDCLYLPYDYEKKGNKGYAFINFTSPLHILYFYEKFNGKKWLHFESSKICELNCAHFQGVNEIQKHAKNFKDLKKTSHYSDKENNELIIPSKYIYKFKKRFPKMQYNENKAKKILVVKSFE